MAVVWPSKNNFANGDVLTATNMNNIADTLNVFNPTSATNGQIWIANGSGSGSYQTLTVNSMVQLATASLSGTNVNIGSIPSGYKKLILVGYGWDIPNGTGVALTMNSDTGSNYTSITYRRFQAANSAYGYNAHVQIEMFFGGNGSTTNGNFALEINNYANTADPKYCSFYATGADNTGTRSAYGGGAGEWNSTSAITSLQLRVGSTGFSAGTYFLYGVN